MLDRLKNRVLSMVTKALVKAVYDSNELQLLKVSALSNEIIDQVERLQPYGLSAHPPIDSEAILLSVGSGRDHAVAVVVDNAECRPQGLKAHEVVVYSKAGSRILLTADNKIVFTADRVELLGSSDNLVKYAALKDGFDSLRLTVNALIAAFNAHSGHAPSGAMPTAVAASTADISGAKVNDVMVGG
jgi:phage gp45-like